jgi:ABC-type glycerol-3-phosphate transport system permease component
MGITRKKNAFDIIIYFFLFLSMVMCLVPILNTIAISFSEKSAAGSGRVFIWPIGWNLAPYGELLKDIQFFRSFGMSVMRVVLGGIVNVALCVLTAYPLSKPPVRFPTKTRYMWFLVFLMLFNGGMIPTYVLVVNLGLINSVWSLVLPGAVPIFSVIILMNFYKTIPDSLEEAALMDGATPWYILRQIFIPLAKPSIAVIALWAIVGHWNSFFDGLIYIPDTERQPLQTYIQQLTVSIDWQNAAGMRGEDIARMMSVSNITFNSAKVVVAMVPILIVYPFLQRFFVTGLVMGSVKE